MKVLVLCVSAFLLSCCASRHHVQLTPDSWTPPARYASCAVQETVRIPLEVGGPLRTVTILACQEGLRVVDHYTKQDVETR